MADVKIPDTPGFVEKEHVYTAQPVRALTMWEFAQQHNWLNFYARRVYPYRRYGAENTTNTNFVYPVGGEDYSTRELFVLVGIRHDEIREEVRVGETISVSSSYMGGIGTNAISTSTAYDQLNYDYAQLSPLTDDVGVSYYFVSVPVSGETVELIEVACDDGSFIDGVGAWELPPGVGESSVGGVPMATSKIPDTANFSIDMADYFPGVDIAASDIQDNIKSSKHGCLEHGRIFFHCGRPHTNSSVDWSISSGTGVEVPPGGIFFPPCQGIEGQDYVTVHGAVWGSAPGSNVVSIKSESLSYTASGISLSTTNQWYPYSSNSAAAGSWSGNPSTFTGRADPDGDWLFLELDGPQSLYAVTLWVENT
jgi:hypothetical protein